MSKFTFLGEVVLLTIETEPRKGRELADSPAFVPGNGMPTEEKTAAERQLLLAFAPLHRSAMGEACGIVGGVALAAATLVLVLRGGYPEPNLGLLSQFFWGYSISWRGVLVGLFWGWATGFTLGWGFALVRNAVVWIWLTAIRSRAEMDQYSDFLDHL